MLVPESVAVGTGALLVAVALAGVRANDEIGRILRSLLLDNDR